MRAFEHSHALISFLRLLTTFYNSSQCHNSSQRGYSMPSYFTASEVAERLRVTPATINRWHRNGKIPGKRASLRPVLFDIAEVEKAISSGGKSSTEEVIRG